MIRHRNQLDRCWMDDVELYRAFGLDPPDNCVGDKVAMLKNCERYIELRCKGGGNWPTYAELLAENTALKQGDITR